MTDSLEELYPGVKEARISISAATAAERWTPFDLSNGSKLRIAFFEGFKTACLDGLGLIGLENKVPRGRPKKANQEDPPPITVQHPPLPVFTGTTVACPQRDGDLIDTAFCDKEFGCPSDPSTCQARRRK
jgi:hypothetical protein